MHQVLSAVEAQAVVGMRPYVLTPQGECLKQSCFRNRSLEAPNPVSLLNAWGEVRKWRRNLMETEVERGIPAANADLVHAHCFSAGMAAVRNCSAVVYDFCQPIESTAQTHAGAQGNPHSQPPHPQSKDLSWLARSFAVAEQFVLTRAGAVVVHAGAMRENALRRGCAPENVFQIPEPLSPEVMDFLAGPQSLVPGKVAGTVPVKTDDQEGIVFFAPDVCLQADPSAPQQAIKNIEFLLQAFALWRQEIASARLFVVATAVCAVALLERATALGIADFVFAVPADECERMFAESHVVIALGETSQASAPENRLAGSSAVSPHVFSSALRGMIAGRALLAADSSCHRDLSPHGRGLLWFRNGDVQDLASRAAFLARNPGLCDALATTARRHLLETRSPEAVGCQYDAVYQRVFARRKTDGSTPVTGIHLQPLLVCF
ncbi:MAG TPA: glycosyltransferase [Terriglobales bacterium]|nr:glycosyltransferase [Terriglobales bacterium]